MRPEADLSSEAQLTEEDRPSSIPDCYPYNNADPLCDSLWGDACLSGPDREQVRLVAFEPPTDVYFDGACRNISFRALNAYGDTVRAPFPFQVSASSTTFPFPRPIASGYIDQWSGLGTFNHCPSGEATEEVTFTARVDAGEGVGTRTWNAPSDACDVDPDCDPIGSPPVPNVVPDTTLETSVDADFGSIGISEVSSGAELSPLDLLLGSRRCKTRIFTDTNHYWGRFKTNETVSFLGDNNAAASRTRLATPNRINLYSEASRVSQGGSHAWAWGNVGFAARPNNSTDEGVNLTLSTQLKFIVNGFGSALVMNPLTGDAEARTRFQVDAYSLVGEGAPVHGGEHFDESLIASSSVTGGGGDRIDYFESKVIALPSVTGPIGGEFKWYVRGKSSAEAEAFGAAGGQASTDLSEVGVYDETPSGSEYLEASMAQVTIDSPSNYYWVIRPGESGTNCQ